MVWRRHEQRLFGSFQRLNTAHRWPSRLQLEPRAMLSVDGDYNRDGYADLAIGVPVDSFGGTRGGAVLVLNGFHVGLIEIDHRLWFQSYLSSTDGTENGDNFGFAPG